VLAVKEQSYPLQVAEIGDVVVITAGLLCVTVTTKFSGAGPLSLTVPLMGVPPGTLLAMLMLIAAGGSMRSVSERLSPPAEPSTVTVNAVARGVVLT